MRFVALALIALGAAGCESPCPGTTGTLTGTFAGSSFTLTCFQAFLVNSGGQSIQFTGTAGNNGANGSELQMTFAARTGCNFQTGETVNLTDACVLVQLAVPNVGGLATNVGGTPPLGTGAVPGVDTRGTFVLQSWTVQARTAFAVSFQPGAQLTFDGQLPNGAVGLTGDASGLLIP